MSIQSFNFQFLSIQDSITTQLLLPLEPLKRRRFAFFFNSELKKKNQGEKKEKENIKGRSPSPESKQDKGPKSASTQSTKASNGLH